MPWSGWGPLATQFCLELAFGVLVAMCFVPRAPVGRLFYRVMGTAALLPSLVAWLLPTVSRELSWVSPQALATALAVAAYPLYSGPARGARWAVSLGAAILLLGFALVLHLGGRVATQGALGWAAASATSLATGCVAGSVGLAMVLGHWYLTIPTLPVSHLRRLNRVCVACILLSLLAVAASCAVFAEELEEAQRPLFAPWGLFHLGTRVAVGLLLPLLFAWMTAESLKYRNTRSATGILYASTVLVLIGAAVSVSLQDSYGIPL